MSEATQALEPQVVQAPRVKRGGGRKPGQRIGITQAQIMAAQALLTCTTQREAANKVGVQENRISVWKKDPQFQAYMDTLRRGTVEQGDKARQIATKSLALADRNVDALHDADPVTGLQGAAVAIRVAKDFNEGFGSIEVRRRPIEQMYKTAALKLHAYLTGFEAALRDGHCEARIERMRSALDKLRARVAVTR